MTVRSVAELIKGLIERAERGGSKIAKNGAEMKQLIEKIQKQVRETSPEQALINLIAKESGGKNVISPEMAAFLLKSSKINPQSVNQLNLRKAFAGANKVEDFVTDSSTLKKQADGAFSGEKPIRRVDTNLTTGIIRPIMPL